MMACLKDIYRQCEECEEREARVILYGVNKQKAIVHDLLAYLCRRCGKLRLSQLMIEEREKEKTL